MNRAHNPQPAEHLEALLTEAANYALHSMQTAGEVPPIVIADTDDGFVYCMPYEMADEASKDRFAEGAKLLAIGYHARALVMVVESWVTMEGDDTRLSSSRVHSEDPQPKEIVALILEDHHTSGTSMLPILRDESGAFSCFGPPSLVNFNGSEGRFSQLMPLHRPNPEEADLARNKLHALGMNVKRQGFDHSMN